MKLTILIALLTLSATTQASILRFKTTSRCETAQKVKGSELITEIQEAQDGQTQLVITFSGQQPQNIQVKTILPPKMSAGAPVKYVGKDIGSDSNVTLAVYTTRVKVGNVFGRSAKFTIQNVFEDLAMVCVAK